MNLLHNWRDPLKFGAVLWPHVNFYGKQREVITSVVRHPETYCVAGNQLGKDFVAAFIVLWFFLTRSPCRVITTSAVEHQLEGVLWGELRRFIQTSVHPLTSDLGGPLLVNHLHLRKVNARGEICGVSYVKGFVSKKGEGMLGHHASASLPTPQPIPTIDQWEDQNRPHPHVLTDPTIPRTLLVVDEASGVDDLAIDRAETWAKRILVIGNAFPCRNFWYRGITGGSIEVPTPQPTNPPTQNHPGRSIEADPTPTAPAATAAPATALTAPAAAAATPPTPPATSAPVEVDSEDALWEE